jgi:hypothetical protein
MSLETDKDGHATKLQYSSIASYIQVSTAQHLHLQWRRQQGRTWVTSSGAAGLLLVNCLSRFITLVPRSSHF